LDLFAGSGGLGIEALSRGASRATFVEANPDAVAMIKSNLALTGLADRAEVIRQKAESFAEGSRFRPQETFDVVFADPPYELGIPSAALEALAGSGRLAPDALVVVEVSSRLEDLNPPAGYRLLEVRRYGDSKLLYLQPEQGDH
ncbi:MAG TPA: RsmD family RNA methyltransferase, partial [Actinomycetota bacterium]|nr:RsmD family RNA methyltransferase [Actinomycetota bacterium]